MNLVIPTYGVPIIKFTMRTVNTLVFTNINNCDSTVILNLTINQSDTSTENITTCESYIWNGEIYYQSGIYTYESQTINGCDSIAILNLTINNSEVSVQNISTCDNYAWNGNIYSESGTYEYFMKQSMDVTA